jgi:hypothetical protein
VSWRQRSGKSDDTGPREAGVAFMPNKDYTETFPVVSCLECARLLKVMWMPVEGPAKCVGCGVELV